MSCILGSEYAQENNSYTRYIIITFYPYLSANRHVLRSVCSLPNNTVDTVPGGLQVILPQQTQRSPSPMATVTGSLRAQSCLPPRTSPTYIQNEVQRVLLSCTTTYLFQCTSHRDTLVERKKDPTPDHQIHTHHTHESHTTGELHSTY